MSSPGRPEAASSAPAPDGIGASASVASPCIGNCRVDPATQLCMGCFRTLDEIARWGAADAAEQRAILARAAQRLGGEGRTKSCSHCRTSFSCGVQGGQCWCFGLPAVDAATAGADCLCPICLRQAGRGNAAPR